MGKILIIIAGLILISVWLGFLIPQYFAWKNKHYKTVAICLSALAINIMAFVMMIIYGDFINVLLYGTQKSQSSEANEFILCVLGFIWVTAQWFCWWYIYGRKSLDFIPIKGYTADELDKIISPEFKKLIRLK